MSGYDAYSCPDPERPPDDRLVTRWFTSGSEVGVDPSPRTTVDHLPSLLLRDPRSLPILPWTTCRSTMDTPSPLGDLAGPTIVGEGLRQVHWANLPLEDLRRPPFPCPRLPRLLNPRVRPEGGGRATGVWSGAAYGCRSTLDPSLALDRLTPDTRRDRTGDPRLLCGIRGREVPGPYLWTRRSPCAPRVVPGLVL